MELNFLYLFLAALIPLAVGFVWYNPAVAGKAWMQSAGLSEEKLKGGNMAIIFGLSYLFSLFIASALAGMSIHQMGIFQLLGADPEFATKGSEVNLLFTSFMEKYGNNHRSFGHGALHGAFAAVTFALPLIAINAMFERRGWKYIWIHAAYWTIALTLMGGVICAFM